MRGQVKKELCSIAKAVYVEWRRGPLRSELPYVNRTSGHLFATESDPVMLLLGHGEFQGKPRDWERT